MNGQVDVILGAQMGDEGKGRITYQLAGEGYQAVVRYNGGANAGHTFEYLEQEINTHQIPSGITYPRVLNLITDCSLFDPTALHDEMSDLRGKGIEISPANLGISQSTSLVLPHHIMLDAAREAGSRKQGSTKRGIAFAAGDKATRSGVFFHQLETNPDEVEEKVIRGIQAANVLLEDMGREAYFLKRDPKTSYQEWLATAKGMLPYMVDTTEIVRNTLRRGEKILAEGAQSTGLDMDHGVRPENTSSITGVAGAQQSLGVGPSSIDTVYIVGKLLKSRVGGSDASFPTKIHDKILAERLRGEPGAKDREQGKSTGRLRDMGWPDLTDFHVAIDANGAKEAYIAVNKLDSVPLAGGYVQLATGYRKTDGSGTVIKHRPNHVELMAGYEPIYELFPTWTEDIRGITNYKDLPRNARRFVEAIQEHLGLPVTMIGTGPDKHQIIDLHQKAA